MLVTFCELYLLLQLATTAFAASIVPLRDPGRDLSTERTRRTDQGASVSSRIAFLFVLEGCFLLEPVWQKWFSQVDPQAYRLVVHQDGVQHFGTPPVPFSGPGIPQQNIQHMKWRQTPRFSQQLATLSLSMMKQAFKDPDVQCFLVVSATTVPLRSFAELHRDYIDAETGRCRYSVAAVRTTPNCGFIVSKSPQWLLLPRDEVEVLINSTGKQVSQAMQTLSVVSPMAYSSSFWVNETCNLRGMSGAADEFMIPTLLSMHYEGQDYPSRGVRFLNGTLTSNTGYWFDTPSEESELLQVDSLLQYAVPQVEGFHAQIFNGTAILQSDLRQLSISTGYDLIRKIVFPDLSVSREFAGLYSMLVEVLT